MEKEHKIYLNNEEVNPDSVWGLTGSTTYHISESSLKVILPLQMIWEPKDDITTLELAKCLPYLLRKENPIYAVDQNESHFRHFNIIDHNKK
jgi:hypothetical protein